MKHTYWHWCLILAEGETAWLLLSSPETELFSHYIYTQKMVLKWPFIGDYSLYIFIFFRPPRREKVELKQKTYLEDGLAKAAVLGDSSHQIGTIVLFSRWSWRMIYWWQWGSFSRCDMFIWKMMFKGFISDTGGILALHTHCSGLLGDSFKLIK